MIVVFCVAVGIGIGYTLAYYQNLPSTHFDNNGDGKIDEILISLEGNRSLSEIDQNFDEKFDHFVILNEASARLQSLSDTDFDGEIDLISYYEDNNIKWTKRFKPPYPNRGILIVNAIGVPGIVILIQVHAYIEP